MINKDDISIDHGRMEGGAFVAVRHIPSQISKWVGPIKGSYNLREIVQKCVAEIESDLESREAKKKQGE